MAFVSKHKSRAESKESLRALKAETDTKNKSKAKADKKDRVSAIETSKFRDVVNKPMPNSFNSEKRIAFLQSLAETGIIIDACEIASVSRFTVMWHYNNDREFKDLFDTCMSMGVMALEDEAKKRAMRGVEKEVYYKGEYVGTTTEYSDFLLQFLLKGYRPQFSDQSQRLLLESNRVTDQINGQIDFSKMTDAELQSILNTAAQSTEQHGEDAISTGESTLEKNLLNATVQTSSIDDTDGTD